MESNLTNLYKDYARNDVMTIEKAVAFLENEAVPRSFSEIVGKFCNTDDPQKTLVEGLKNNHSDLAAGSVEKRVRSWFQGKHSLRKQDAIELCFILHLTLEQADDFVSLISEEKLHWRDPDEVADIFALQHGYSYDRAVSLKKKIKPLLEIADSQNHTKEIYYTSFIRKEISAINTEMELEDYLTGSAWKFGKLHNNAYCLFMQRLKSLETPEVSYNDGEGEKLTIREILREYMYESNVAYAKKKARYSLSNKGGEGKLILSAIQKSVSSNWPDETTLSKMKSRKTDVTRKALILLLMATEEGFRNGLDGEDTIMYGYEPSKEEVFDDVYGRLNQTLLDCGFATLDPRSPFDWMILYSICVQDMFDADIRMRMLFQTMFGEREEEGN